MQSSVLFSKENNANKPNNELKPSQRSGNMPSDSLNDYTG